MNPLHIFKYPFVVKQVSEFLMVSVPDFEINVSEVVTPEEVLNKDYVAKINKLFGRAIKLLVEKQSRLQTSGKTHYRPPSFIRQSLQIKNNESITTKVAAQYLGISEASLKRWELAGAIKATKTRGGHRSFNLGELDRVKGEMQKGLKPLNADETELEKNRELLEGSGLAALHNDL
jgi:DNA-binding transcriptional regulator YiaG